MLSINLVLTTQSKLKVCPFPKPTTTTTTTGGRSFFFSTWQPRVVPVEIEGKKKKILWKRASHPMATKARETLLGGASNRIIRFVVVVVVAVVVVVVSFGSSPGRR